MPVFSREQSWVALQQLSAWGQQPACGESATRREHRAETAEQMLGWCNTTVPHVWDQMLWQTLWVPRLGRQLSTEWERPGSISWDSLKSRTGMREGTWDTQRPRHRAVTTNPCLIELWFSVHNSYCTQEMKTSEYFVLFLIIHISKHSAQLWKMCPEFCFYTFLYI